MNVCAIEQSTPYCSLAVYAGDRALAAADWHEPGVRHHSLFAHLEAAVRASGLDWPAIAAFVVGLGPGSFSGLRMALAAARALALPDGRPVYGCESPRVIAWQAMREGHAAVAVIGDARRERWWVARYRRGPDGLPECLLPPTLHAAGEVGAAVAGCALFSPDADRVRLAFGGGNPLPHCEPAIPRATVLAELAGATPGGLPEACRPIYMHPATTVAPRFG